MERGHIYFMGEAIYKPGARYTAGGGQAIPGEEPYSLVKAFEPETAKVKWEFRLHGPARAGLLSTAGGLVFGSSGEGDFFALDSQSGKPLWRFQTGGRMASNPVSYAVDGEQRIAIAAGHAIYVFGLDQ